MSNTGQAWVTLATNDSYALGALVLAQSLRRNNTIHQLAVLITPGVTPSMREVLSSIFDFVKEVDVLDSNEPANLALLGRPDLGVTFTKLHCWNLTQYSKCVFLDADTLVVRNCDELFEREELSAAPDAGWPDCFNSGVFVFTPSEATFKALVEFAAANGSFDGGDQGLLNMYFGDWATKDIEKHLPFIYNMVATATYSYLPAFKTYGGNVKIAHFIGSNKPWLQVSPTSSALSSFLELWWNIFLSDVAKKLQTNMRFNCTVFEEGLQAPKLFFTPPPSPPSNVQRHVFVDPWEYVQVHPTPTDKTTFSTEDVIDRLVEHLKLTNETNLTSEFDSRTSYNPRTFVKKFSDPQLFVREDSFMIEPTQTYSNVLRDGNTKPLEQHHQRHVQNQYGQLPSHKEDVDEEPLDRVESYENNPKTIPLPINPMCVEQNSFDAKSEEPKTNVEEGGLAGALAGGKRDIIEDHWRKQSWEQGNIDYLGRDAFENIWKKISETVGEDIKPLEEPSEQKPAPLEEVQTVPPADQPTPVVAKDATDLPEPEAAPVTKQVSEVPTLEAEQVPAVDQKTDAPKSDLLEQSLPAEVPKSDEPEVSAPVAAVQTEEAPKVETPESTTPLEALATQPPVPVTIEVPAQKEEPALAVLETEKAPVVEPPSLVSAVPAVVVEEKPIQLPDNVPQALPQPAVLPETPTIADVPPTSLAAEPTAPTPAPASSPASDPEPATTPEVKSELPPTKIDSVPTEAPVTAETAPLPVLEAVEPVAKAAAIVVSATEGAKAETPPSPSTPTEPSPPSTPAVDPVEPSSATSTVGDAPVPPKRRSTKGKKK